MILNHITWVRFPVAVVGNLIMQFDILTIFPEQIKSFISEGIYRISQDKGHKIQVHNLRDWTTDAHKSVDDRPFGGGAGMLMKIEPIFNALKDIKVQNSKVILTTPVGKKLNQKMVVDLAQAKVEQYVIIAGHYEGFDFRIHEHLVDFEISIGDFVLSGGELPALIIVDSMLRRLPGVLGNDESVVSESFEGGILEYPQYTRPADFNGWKVPEVLQNGNHAEIEKWRVEQAKELTKKRRSDLTSG